jgi:glycosyltransferase involved in cell wall biosynthesis
MARIGINAVVLTPQSGGLLVYVQNLIDNLLALKSEIQIQLFFSHNFLKQFPNYAKLPNSTGLSLNGENPKLRILKESFVWQKVIREFNLDLFHSPISYIPFGVKIPAVVTIHDLGFFHQPQNYTRLRVKFLQQMIARAAKRADRIIAISEFTRKDVIEYFKIPADKVTCIYQGFDAERFQKKYPLEQITQIKNKYRLPEKFILSVGHLEPRKNFNRLLQAFYEIRQQERIPYKLIIVGRENWLFTSFYKLMEQFNLQEDVIFTGFVDHDDLAALYQLADLFVLPTLFEGFGFPLLESMAAGTPVVCSNATCLPEIGQNAAIYFNPYDVGDMSQKILDVLKNIKLKENLVNRGYENINRFNWRSCAEETIRVYQEGLS